MPQVKKGLSEAMGIGSTEQEDIALQVTDK